MAEVNAVDVRLDHMLKRLETLERRCRRLRLSLVLAVLVVALGAQQAWQHLDRLLPAVIHAERFEVRSARFGTPVAILQAGETGGGSLTLNEMSGAERASLGINRLRASSLETDQLRVSCGIYAGLAENGDPCFVLHNKGNEKERFVARIRGTHGPEVTMFDGVGRERFLLGASPKAVLMSLFTTTTDGGFSAMATDAGEVSAQVTAANGKRGIVQLVDSDGAKIGCVDDERRNRCAFGIGPSGFPVMRFADDGGNDRIIMGVLSKDRNVLLFRDRDNKDRGTLGLVDGNLPALVFADADMKESVILGFTPAKFTGLAIRGPDELNRVSLGTVSGGTGFAMADSTGRVRSRLSILEDRESFTLMGPDGAEHWSAPTTPK
ncbi:MAG: hypothetical protein FD180_159 [Planctomycetota bacterium]|nr:MAG: hypothetical protein FD180_159 [Planctomycetota bacterium]